MSHSVIAAEGKQQQVLRSSREQGSRAEQSRKETEQSSREQGSRAEQSRAGKRESRAAHRAGAERAEQRAAAIERAAEMSGGATGDGRLATLDLEQ